MRKRYSPTLKASIVLEMLKEEKSISQLAAEHGVHPTLLHQWRRQALENLHQLFADKQNADVVRAECERKVEDLYAEIGRLTTQIAWLKKKGIHVE